MNTIKNLNIINDSIISHLDIFFINKWHALFNIVKVIILNYTLIKNWKIEFIIIIP